MSEHRDILACMKVAELSVPYPGSIKELCLDCKEPIWISPANAKFAIERNLEPLCMGCIGSRAEA